MDGGATGSEAGCGEWSGGQSGFHGRDGWRNTLWQRLFHSLLLLWSWGSGLHCWNGRWNSLWQRLFHSLLLLLGSIQVDSLRIGLSGASSPVSHVDPDVEWPHNIHPDEAWGRFQDYIDDETSPTASFALLEVQMLGFSSNLEWLAVCAMHCPFKRLQGPPLGTVAPPYGESHAGHGCSSVHEAKEGDAF